MTPRVVHLIDAASAGSVASASAVVADIAVADRGREHRLMLLGRARDAAACCAVGAPPIATILAPMREPPLATRRIVAALHRSNPDAIVAWGVGALAAALAAREVIGAAVAFVADVGPHPSRAASLACSRLRRGSVASIAFDAAIADEMLRTLGIAATVVDPPLDRSRLAGERAELREAWDADDGTLVVALATAPIAWGDARRAADAVGIPRVRGARIRLLVHPDAARVAATRGWLRDLRLLDLLRIEPRLETPWRLLAGIDLLLRCGDGLHTCGASADGGRRGAIAGARSLRARTPSPLPMLWAQAAGVPVLDARAAEACGERAREGRRVAISRAVLAQAGIADAGMRPASTPLPETCDPTLAAASWCRALRLPVGSSTLSR